MKAPFSWIKQYAPVACDTKTFIDRMTISGSKVEALERVGEGIRNVAVGRILSVEKHPNADKLVVTQVDVGNETLQIVTGATNVYPGAVVPVAKDGAVLAGGKEIKNGELRGVPSNGMLCSVEELGASRADFPEAPEDGIYIFPEASAPPLGMDAADALELRADVIEFEITSNRADCFSVYGLAREAAAAFDAPLAPMSPVLKEAGGGAAKDYIEVEIQNAALCPRYTARVVKNVRIAPSPQWMRRRLSLCGVRPINNIVDITNYVMLELGQPMHAFDIDQIAGGKIIVRSARAGEPFTTLDGGQRALDADMLVIADTEKAVAIAGVMGGENSKVTDTAPAILFESANFNGASIRKTSKKLGLRTDASSKYEKGIDPDLTLLAVNRAVELVELLDCGDVVPGYVDCYPSPRATRAVPYRPESINRLLGTAIDGGEMARLLARVGITTADGVAQAPTFRPDIALEADIAEEIARLYGYDKIPETLVKGETTAGGLNRLQTLEGVIQDTLTALGFCEALTLAFESPKVFDKLNIPAGSPLRETVNIVNPLGEDYSVMRSQLANAMLTALSTNYSKRNERAALFEIAKRYEPTAGEGTPLSEIKCVVIGAYGGWDFYRLKGAVEALFERLGIRGAQAARLTDMPMFHPGRAAVLEAGGKPLGRLGEIHPAVLSRYEIGTRAYIAVLDVAALAALSDFTAKYRPVPRFPGVKRDLAFTVREDVPAREMEAAIRAAGGTLLEDARLFDVYTGAGVEEGCKSVAYSVFFRAPDRTMKDEEAAEAIQAIIAELAARTGAKLRA